MTDTFPLEAVELLLSWYGQNARDLPWRHTKDPYAILVSEIMLQQTRAETVKPYFARFMKTLPTLSHLAEADEDTLHKLWEGLGYYSRVRNLQRAARTVMDKHGGQIPSDYDELLALSGVGRYTAGAVASIAFDIPVPAVDGNVLRVVARVMGEEGDVLLDATRRRIEACLAPVVPSPRAGDFNQSLIELGATVCLPTGEAKCHACPLQLICTAKRQGRVAELPVRVPKVKRRAEALTVLVLAVADGGEDVSYVIRRRPAKGLLGGLYEFPNVEGHLTEAQVWEHLAQNGLTVHSVTPLPHAKHVFTHIDWQMQGYLCTVTSPSLHREILGGFCATPQEIREVYTLPSAFRAYRRVALGEDE